MSGRGQNARKTSAKAGPLLSALKAEAMKSRHASPVWLAIALALPFPLLAVFIALRMPQFGLQYSPWNYWYVLLMPVSISLIAATVANADARMGNRALLSCGVPLSCAWTAKVAWCLALSLLSNLVVFAIYCGLALVVPEGAASMQAMLATALSLVVTSSWMVPATIFLTMRAGLLVGVFVPLGVQLAVSFGWSAVPFWPACPPAATIMLPTAFLPVLPSGEPASAGMALVESMTRGGDVALALVISCVLTAALTVAGAAWLSRSEELR